MACFIFDRLLGVLIHIGICPARVSWSQNIFQDTGPSRSPFAAGVPFSKAIHPAEIAAVASTVTPSTCPLASRSSALRADFRSWSPGVISRYRRGRRAVCAASPCVRPSSVVWRGSGGTTCRRRIEVGRSTPREKSPPHRLRCLLSRGRGNLYSPGQHRRWRCDSRRGNSNYRRRGKL